jgi:hypothetical protein
MESRKSCQELTEVQNSDAYNRSESLRVPMLKTVNDHLG